MPDPCSIVNPGCETPAGWLGGDGELMENDEGAAFECWRCGNAVCRSCSSRDRDNQGADARVCADCAEDDPASEAPERVEIPPEDPGGMRVMSRHCATCIFTTRTPVGRRRMDDLARTWARTDGYQVCHAAGIGIHDDDEEDGDEETLTLHGDDVVCHGFMREVFLERGTGQALRISVRLGGFHYVDPDDYGKDLL